MTAGEAQTVIVAGTLVEVALRGTARGQAYYVLSIDGEALAIAVPDHGRFLVLDLAGLRSTVPVASMRHACLLARSLHGGIAA